MSDPSPPSSAAAGAERIIVLAGCAIRLGTLVQMLPSAKLAYDVSPHPSLAAATWVLAVSATVGFVVRALTRHGPVRRWEALLDCGVACGLLVLGAWTVPAEVRIGTWVGFQPGYALGVVIANASCRTLGSFVAGVAAVLAGEVVYVWSAVGRPWFTTVLGNFLTVVVLAAIAVAITSYLRRLAAEADIARRLAAVEEQRRASVAFHNGVAMMGLLTEPDLDPSTRSVIQQQARAEIRRVRSYLRGEPTVTATRRERSVQLADLLAGSAREFPDLSPHVMADLAVDTALDPADAEVLSAALTSLLLNIRRHAKASTTVLHGDEQHGEWTVTVHDDGVGFDPAHVELGIGLRRVVIGELEARGIRVCLDSAPGLGTTATLTGRSAR